MKTNHVRYYPRLALGLLIAVSLGGISPSCAKDGPEYSDAKKPAAEQRDADKAAPGKTLLQFFYGSECPHCNRIKPEVESLPESFPGLEVKKYEVWHNASNQDLLAGALEGKKRVEVPGKNSSAQGVPTTIAGDEYYVGSDMTIIKSMVVRSLKKAKGGPG